MLDRMLSSVSNGSPRVTPRYLISSYGLALAIIAILSIASHLVLDRELRLDRDSAAIVNASGRQRMYAQQIASLAARHALGDRDARTRLLATVDAFSRAHVALLRGDASRRVDAGLADPALRTIYLGRRYALNARVAAFVASARASAALNAGDPRIRRTARPLFTATDGTLLAGLNAIVAVHQLESEARLRHLAQLEWVILAIVLSTLGVEALGIFQPMVRRINAYAVELRTLAATDPLTGVLNRRSFNERGSTEIRKSARYGHDLTLLMIDIDHFKAVNDRFGHDGGDGVLRAVSKALFAEIRAFDLLARLGGEEFAVLLPDTDVAGARPLAERLRERIASMKVTTASGPVSVTISIGVAAVDRNVPTLAPSLTLADAALYEAKATGRNRVVVAHATASVARADATTSSSAPASNGDRSPASRTSVRNGASPPRPQSVTYVSNVDRTSSFDRCQNCNAQQSASV